LERADVRVLITNDDGIDSPGISALATVALDLGLDVVVAAPAWNSSGASASITGVSSDGRLLVSRRELPGVSGARAFGIEASPAMIVRVGIRGGFGDPPDLVLSGINDGPNTGHAVLHSGTVGAALTAATHGCRAVAFSLGVAPEPDYRAAIHVAASVIRWALGMPGPLTLNVNVPSGDVSAVRGVRHARLASFGAVATQVTELDEGHVGVSYSEIDPSGEPGSDATLLGQGYATVTALAPVCEEPQVDVAGLAGDVESAAS
jgi:5'-nucleotidase